MKYGFLEDVEFVENYRGEALKGFMQGISILSVPVLRGEAFGLYQLEALASGVPLAQPAVGAFPEIIEATGGGEVYDPNTAEALANKLESILTHVEKIRKLGKKGRKAVEEKFNSQVVVKNMIRIYESVVKTSG